VLTQLLHELHQGVGAEALSAAAAVLPTGAGVVGFIEHHQVVGLGFQQILVAVAPSHQVAGDQH